ncbi:MAG: CARDB domain-containing protein, partial [Coleofasciculus sp. D1-CHI-01]|uniref:CARDB domain-containing protein n=1 Tax=Coleofasciculus sp. D1-CHI-01 TaxID=3068482 RepID=UPI0032F2AD18
GSDFDITPQSLDAGDSFDIDFDITNTGSSAGAFDVSFYLSSNNYISTTDHLLYSGTINGLAGNSTSSFTTSLNLPGVNHSFWDLYGDDTYYIGMKVDSGSDVTEANETNNSNVGFLFDYDDVVINNTQLADLSGLYFDVAPEPLDAGDSFDIDFDITNTGSSAGAFDVSFYLSSNNTISTTDHLLGSATINGLAGNSTGSFITSLNLPGVNHSFWNGDGTYYIGMRVDSGADVTEVNETNNSNVGFLFDYDDVVINNTQLADLSGFDFDVTPQALDAGDSFDIDFDITNTGSSAGAFDVSFYLSSNNTISTMDHLLGSTTINGLAGNSTGSFLTSLNLPSVNDSFWDLYGDDTYYIGMRVDSGADVTEVNETNNSNVGFLFDYDDVVINNTQLADLSGFDFDVTPEPLDAGDSFDIDFDITNTGSSAGAFDVSFYLSSNNTISTMDHLLSSTTINGLAGNSTGSFITSLNLPSVNDSFWDLYGDDTYYIGMRVDSGADVTEVNETNNSNVGFLFDYDDVVINNTQMANLSGLNFNVTPEPLNAGDSFDIDLTIENSGAAAAGVFDVSLYLSSDSNISNSDLLLDTISFTGLAANSSGTFTSNFILPEANDAFWSGDGTYHIGMMIDSGDDITETIETDNANVGLMLDTDNVVINNTQLADLVGVDFNLVQEPLAAGDNFDVNFEVQNTEMFAAGAFDVSFYVSTDNTIDTADQFLGSATINGLAGNSIGAYTTGLTLPGINDSTWNGDGIYYIGMIIDQDGTLPETDETNNSNNGLFVDYDNVLISDTELIGTDDDDTLFGTPGDDILSGLRDDDDLVGGGGDDTLFGDRGDDNLFGEAGNDMLFGDRGDDYLFGGTGNDMLFGDRGDDLLIGVELNLANPGLGEVDSLIGGFGADVFQLGDVFSAYYDDADGTTDGSTDYALITDFDINQDIIELHGSAADYQLATVSPSLPSGIGVFLQSSTPSGQDELIGIVQGESSLSLNDSYFSFV